MHYYEVAVADGRYRGSAALTYGSTDVLRKHSVVTVPLKNRSVTGFVVTETTKPDFNTKPIKNLLSEQALPEHCLELARWLQDYYSCGLGDALRQFAPTRPSLRKPDADDEEKLLMSIEDMQLELNASLSGDQKQALKAIQDSVHTTVLLHGDTGTGKTRVYLELAQQHLESGRSVIMLTPEIALTSQLAEAARRKLGHRIFVIHSRLSVAQRKKIWLDILQSKDAIVVIGPRSALFSPVRNLGLIVVDEAHEPAYKQEQSPRYHAVRVASQLGLLTGAKVVLGTATPLTTDYYLATQHDAIVRMRQPAIGLHIEKPKVQIVDIKDRQNFSISPYLSDQLIAAAKASLAAKKQVLIYLNRRGSARLILCEQCGWQLLCPHCDVPLVYHGDEHTARCHICGYSTPPPVACPNCHNTDIIYKGIGSKALADTAERLFQGYRVQRFDSDSKSGEQAHELYGHLLKGDIDILVGTQQLAKGFDLPRLGLVGIIAAETSLGLPDYTAEERAYQLTSQVIGRVGRGHTSGEIIIQSHNPSSLIISAAIERDYEKFYRHVISERQAFRFPPFAYLLKLTIRRATAKGAENAALRLKKQLLNRGLPVEVIGPSPSFYAKRGRYYYWQLVAKSKQRRHLTQLADMVPADWMIDLDPVDLL